MRRSDPFPIPDCPAVDSDILKWYHGIDLKLLASSLIACHKHLEAASIGTVMIYVTFRAVELDIAQSKRA